MISNKELKLTNTTNLTNQEPRKANVFIFEKSLPYIMMSNSVHLTKGDNQNSGISLPKAIMARIDAVKHPDIPRSKFVLRILEAALMQQEQNYTK
jgi:hypothetical protein